MISELKQIVNEIFNDLNCPPLKEGNSNERRKNGTEIHTFILQKLKEKGYTTEYPIEYSPNNEITLFGRIDAINFDKQEIIDIKTTTQPIEKLNRNPYILQVGTYTKILELQTGKQFSTQIFIKNKTLHVISLTREQIESAYKEMISRAVFASILSKNKKQDISSLSHSRWNRENRLRKMRQWYTNHREQYNAYSREWQAKHPEKVKEYYRKYYAKHREQKLASNRAWYAKHREQDNAHSREWRAKHPEKVKEYHSKWYAKHREQKIAYVRAWYARKKAQQNSSSTLDQYT